MFLLVVSIIIAVCFGMTLISPNKKERSLACAGILISAAMLIYYSSVGDGRLGQIRVDLVGFQFPTQQLAGRGVSLGDELEADVFLMAGDGINLFVRPRGSDLAVEQGPDWRSGDLLAVSGEFANSHELQSGDRIVRRANGADVDSYIFETSFLPGTGRLVPTGGGDPIPLAGAWQCPFGDQCIEMPFGNLAVAPLPAGGQSAPPLPVFLLRSASSPVLILRDAAYVVLPADGSAEIGYRPSVDVDASATIRLVRLTDRGGGKPLEPQSSRDLSVSLADGNIEIRPARVGRQMLDLSGAATADQQSRNLVVTASDNNLEPSTLRLRGMTLAFRDVQAILRFPPPGERLGLFERLSGWFKDRTPQGFMVFDVAGSLTPAYGEVFRIGNDSRILLSVSNVEVPVALLMPFLLVLAAGAVYCAGTSLRFEITVVMTIGCFLATVRFLLAMTAALFPPFHGEAMGFALVGLSLVVLLGAVTGNATAILRLRRDNPRAPPDYVQLLLFLTTLLICVIGFQIGWHQVAPRSSGNAWFLLLLALVPYGVRRWTQGRRFDVDRQKAATYWDARNRWTPWLVLVALVTVMGLRYLAGIFGIQEAIPLGGQRIATTILLVPFLYVLFAFLLCSADRELQMLEHGGRNPAIFAGIGLASIFALGMVTASAKWFDGWGLMLFAIPVALVLYAIVMMYGRIVLGGVKAWRFSLQRYKLVAITFGTPIVVALAAAAYFGTLMTDPTRTTFSSDELRLLTIVNPSASSMLGTIRGDRAGTQVGMMEYYSQSGLHGMGFLSNTKPVPKNYGPALNDNASSTLLMNQFGAFGALGVLIGYMGLLAVLWSPITDARGDPMARRFSVSDFLAALAVASLVFACLYIMAANIGVMPLTGRNIFMLGIDSGSDILEYLLLSALVIQKAFIREWLS